MTTVHTVHLCECAAWYNINMIPCGCAVGELWVVRMLRLCPNENNKCNKESSRSVNEIENAYRILCPQTLTFSKSPWTMHEKKECSDHRPTYLYAPETIYSHITKRKNFLVTDRHSHPPETMYIIKERIFDHGLAFAQPENNEFAHARKTVCWPQTISTFA